MSVAVSDVNDPRRSLFWQASPGKAGAAGPARRGGVAGANECRGREQAAIRADAKAANDGDPPFAGTVAFVTTQRALTEAVYCRRQYPSVTGKRDRRIRGMHAGQRFARRRAHHGAQRPLRQAGGGRTARTSRASTAGSSTGSAWCAKPP
ncbi:MAG: hypothetical protein WDN72_10090 [Alphaproteobacteria bacterium]